MSLTKVTPSLIHNNSFPNLIDNAAMDVWLNGVGPQNISAAGPRLWFGRPSRYASQVTYGTGTGVLTSERSTDVPNFAQVGARLSYSWLLTFSTSESLAANDRVSLQHLIEGYNIAKAWAQPLTFSCWVKFVRGGGSSLTFPITFGVVAHDFNTNKYGFLRTINQEDTWQRISVTIPWLDGVRSITNDIGAIIGITLAAGSNRNITPGSWISDSRDGVGVVGQNNLGDASGNRFYTTGWQLEAGTITSQLQTRPVYQEVLAAQRMRYTISSPDFGDRRVGVAPYEAGQTQCTVTVKFPTSMREAPLPAAFLTSNVASDYAISQMGIGNAACTTVPALLASGNSINQAEVTFISTNATATVRQAVEGFLETNGFLVFNSGDRVTWG